MMNQVKRLSSHVSYPNHTWDSTLTRDLIKVPAGLSENDVIAYVWRAYNFGYRCMCEHDCCGCWNHSAIKIRRKGREVRVEYRSEANV